MLNCVTLEPQVRGTPPLVQFVDELFLGHDLLPKLCVVMVTDVA